MNGKSWMSIIWFVLSIILSSVVYAGVVTFTIYLAVLATKKMDFIAASVLSVILSVVYVNILCCRISEFINKQS
jgi:hypothetical protein